MFEEVRDHRLTGTYDVVVTVARTRVTAVGLGDTEAMSFTTNWLSNAKCILLSSHASTKSKDKRSTA